MSAISFMINGLSTYPLKKEERNTEINTIKHILQQNQYHIQNSLKQKLNKDSTIRPKTKIRQMGHVYILRERNQKNSQYIQTPT
jgi:hypothetical protein